VPTFQVTPGELVGAAGSLRRAGSEVSSVGGRAMRGGGAGDLGAPELEQAVVDVCESSFHVAASLAHAVTLTGRNLGAGAAAYGYVDANVIPGGGG
jgi:hypothetical protein